jgi:hypothetical protein
MTPISYSKDWGHDPFNGRLYLCFMSKFVQEMEYVKTYLDDSLILINSCFKDCLLKLDMVLARLTITNFWNISKSKFFAEKIKYLGSRYWITRKGIQPVCNNVEEIINVEAPKTRKQ